MDKKDRLICRCAEVLYNCNGKKKISENARVAHWSAHYTYFTDVFGDNDWRRAIFRACLSVCGGIVGAVFSENVSQKGQQWLLVTDDLTARFADLQSLYAVVQKIGDFEWKSADCFFTKRLKELEGK